VCDRGEGERGALPISRNRLIHRAIEDCADRHRAGIPLLSEVAALCALRTGSVHRANAARKQISEWSLMTRRAPRMEMALRQREGRRVQFRRLIPVL